MTKFMLPFLCWASIFNMVRYAAINHDKGILILAFIFSFLTATYVFPIFTKNNNKEQKEDVDDEEL